MTRTVLRKTTFSPVCDTSAYASGDLIGTGALKIQPGPVYPGVRSTGTIINVVVRDRAAQAANMDIVFFSAAPSTDMSSMNNAAFDLSDADLGLVIGYAPVNAHSTFNDNGVSVPASPLAIGFDVDPMESIYALPVSRGTPTYAAATDLEIEVQALITDV